MIEGLQSVQPKNDGHEAGTFVFLKIAAKSLELKPASDKEIAGTFFLTTYSTIRGTYGKRCSVNLHDDFFDDFNKRFNCLVFSGFAL